jgi:nickel/cobalt transporter (NicO) family protein
MSFTAPALLAAAAGVGFGHAILPDHWVPLSVIARTQRYPLRRVLRLSGLAGLAHVALSLILGAIIIGVGLQFRSTVEHHENLIVGGLLIATGAVLLVLELRGRGHGHSHDERGGHGHGRGRGRGHDHDHDHDHSLGYDHGHGHHHDHEPADGHDHATATVEVPTSAPLRHEHSRSRAARLLAFAVPFGAAASPDLTILPVFLAAGAVGLATAIGTLIVFSLVTLGAIVGLTVLGAIAGYRLRGAWVDKSANVITAAVLLIIGVLVAGSII